MTTGRDDFLWWSVEHLGGKSLPLNDCPAMESWSQWETMSKMEASLASVLLADTVSREDGEAGQIRMENIKARDLEHHSVKPMFLFCFLVHSLIYLVI